MICVDHEFATQVADTARRRGLRVIEVGRAANGIRLIDCAVDGFCQMLTLAHGGIEISRTAGAARRLSGGKRVGRGRPSDRRRR